MLHAAALISIQLASGLAMANQRSWGSCPLPFLVLVLILMLPAGSLLLTVSRTDQYRLIKTPKGALNTFRALEWSGNWQDWTQALHAASAVALFGWVWAYLAAAE